MADFDLSRGVNTINLLKIPIVFVPGVMGTRLQFTQAPKTPWDPDRALNVMARRWLPLSADQKRAILDVQNDANPIQDPAAGGVTSLQTSRGWGQPVFGFYGSFLRFMDALNFNVVDTPVFAVGYDWRKSNSDSGAFVAGEINRILAQEQAFKVIIISHSMGGLVTRSALHNDAGLRSKLLGIIHVMQPVVGAPVFYRRVYTGNVSPEDDPGILGFSGLNTILGNNGEKFAKLVSVLRGPTELMPTPDYADGTTGDWINYFFGPFLPQHTRVRAADWYPYTELAYPPGLLDLLTTDPQVVTDMNNRVVQAKAFHDNLGLFKHERTFTIFSTNLPTDVAFFDDQNGHVDLAQCRRREGDGTVPASSASILFPGQRNTLADLCNGDPRQFVVPNVPHAEGMKDGRIQALVQGIIEKMLGLRCFIVMPPPPPPQKRSTDDSRIDVGRDREPSDGGVGSSGSEDG